MQRAEKGNQVIVEYEGMIKGGEIFENTAETGPLEFQLGSAAVFPAFEEALLGMAAGETKSVELPPAAAFGPKKEELVQSFGTNVFGKMQPKPGMVLGMNLEKDGRTHRVPGLVLEVTSEKVIIDFNHPLAGKTLVYKITLKSIQPSPGCANSIPAAGRSCPTSGCSSCH